VLLLVRLNQQLQQETRYLLRMEPGVQTPEETLALGCGSCRDSAWLLVQILRHLGIAARFASGYLIQLVADVKPLDGPAGTDHDFTDLHAWAEAYIPGAGWIGFDPTSGLLSGEGHLPLACSADPGNAAPVIGFTDVCETEFSVDMHVTRIHEDPRVTKPYSDAQWKAIDALGEAVDRELDAHDVRLTQGGEPTFVSVDDMDGPEWNTAALSPAKRSLAQTLHRAARVRFATGAAARRQGKWYPASRCRGGHSASSGATTANCCGAMRRFADTTQPGGATHETPTASCACCWSTRLPESMVLTAWRTCRSSCATSAALPVNVDPLQADLSKPTERRDSRGCLVPVSSGPRAACSR
jgi:hypothetical protein